MKTIFKITLTVATAYLVLLSLWAIPSVGSSVIALLIVALAGVGVYATSKWVRSIDFNPIVKWIWE